MSTSTIRATPRVGATLPIIAALATAYLAAVLWLTVRPLPWVTETNETPLGVLNPAAWLDTAAWVDGPSAEIVANVVMFLPAGVFSALLLRGGMRVLAPLALTVLIEVVQIPLESRISHPRDLVANALGAMLGLAAVAVARWMGRRMRQGTASARV